jgi:hypothetical protein
MKHLRPFNENHDHQLLKIEKSPIHGLGLFTEQDLKKGQIVCEIGNISEMDGSDRWMTRISRFVNHNSYPNSRVRIDGDRCYIESVSDISSGEEITTDYRKIPEFLDQTIYQ